jgi:hypothetical protein
VKKNWPESKDKEAEVEVRAEAKKLPRTGLRSPKRKRRNLILTLKEEEAHKEGIMPIELLFLEKEEVEEVEVVR